MTPRKSPDDTERVSVPSRTSEKTRARIDELRPHPRNPRKISPARLEQLQRTLEAEPEMLEARPLIALPDGTVVAGNQRLEAARRLGWETIPVVYADLGEDEVTRWMLLDNRPFGEDDREQAAALLAELEGRGQDLELTGYSQPPVSLSTMTRPSWMGCWPAPQVPHPGHGPAAATPANRSAAERSADQPVRPELVHLSRPRPRHRTARVAWAADGGASTSS